MSGFKYKDLMITVGYTAPGSPGRCYCYGLSFQHTYQRRFADAVEAVRMGAGELGGGPQCALPTVPQINPFNPCAASGWPCVLHTTVSVWCPPLCPPLTCQPTVAGPVAYAGPGPEELAAVKDQLRRALADIEQQEREEEESMQPQTAAEVESLQTKLHEAISELEKRKEELRRKSRE